MIDTECRKSYIPSVPNTQPLPLLTPQEVADLFRVDVRTVTAWAREGRLQSVQTLGGHYRFERAEVERLMQSRPSERAS